MKKPKCLHKSLMYLENDQVAENKIYNKKDEIQEYDDFKLYIFNCNTCGEIVVKRWLRSHFKINAK